MIAKTGKVWGVTTPVLVTPLVEVHRLEILPKAQCSVHRHQYKWNAFIVISGTLYIDVRKTDYKLTDTTTLKKGDVCTVRPNEAHCFRTGDEPVVAFELYYPSVLSEDIIRENVGSVRGAKAKKRRRS